MAIGLIGKKSGMTRIFNEEGESVPVTVIEAEPNRVTQVKSVESDGYKAIQVTTGERRRSRGCQFHRELGSRGPLPHGACAGVRGGDERDV